MRSPLRYENCTLINLEFARSVNFIFHVKKVKINVSINPSSQATNDYSKLDLVESPTLFFEFHGSEAGLEQQTELVKELADMNGGSDFKFASQQEDRNRLWTAR